jgi:hypothetical protein
MLWLSLTFIGQNKKSFHACVEEGCSSSLRIATFSYPEPFLRAVRRGALAKSGYHKNMVKEYIRY